MITIYCVLNVYIYICIYIYIYIYIRLPAFSPSVVAVSVASSAIISVNTKQHHYVRYKILTVMNMKFMVIKDVMPNSLVGRN